MADAETITSPISLFPGLLNTDSFIINAFDMHVVALVLLLITGVLAAIIVWRNYSKLFTTWMMLAVAFGFIACIGVFELCEHTNVPPGLHFWHYMHLAVGLGALYFFNLFTGLWGVKEPERRCNVIKDITSVFIVLFGVAGAIYWTEVSTGIELDLLVFVLMLISTIVLLTKIGKNIQNINETTKGTFSLKVFIVTATIYSIIAAVSLMMVDVGIMGTALTIWGHTSVTTLARIFQNMFYGAISTLLVLFSLATIRADQYYAPLMNFLAQNNNQEAKGQKKGK